MTAKNDITGDSIRSKTPSQKYVDNFDAIFRKKKEEDKNDDKKEIVDNLPDT